MTKQSLLTGMAWRVFGRMRLNVCFHFSLVPLPSPETACSVRLSLVLCEEDGCTEHLSLDLPWLTDMKVNKVLR